MNNDVCLNIKYDMEFIKQHFFIKMMEDSSYKENEETFRDLFVPEMDKFLNVLNIKPPILCHGFFDFLCDKAVMLAVACSFLELELFGL